MFPSSRVSSPAMAPPPKQEQYSSRKTGRAPERASDPLQGWSYTVRPASTMGHPRRDRNCHATAPIVRVMDPPHFLAAQEPCPLGWTPCPWVDGRRVSDSM